MWRTDNDGCQLALQNDSSSGLAEKQNLSFFYDEIPQRRSLPRCRQSKSTAFRSFAASVWFKSLQSWLRLKYSMQYSLWKWIINLYEMESNGCNVWDHPVMGVPFGVVVSVLDWDREVACSNSVGLTSGIASSGRLSSMVKPFLLYNVYDMREVGLKEPLLCVGGVGARFLLIRLRY